MSRNLEQYIRNYYPELDTPEYWKAISMSEADILVKNKKKSFSHVLSTGLQFATGITAGVTGVAIAESAYVAPAPTVGEEIEKEQAIFNEYPVFAGHAVRKLTIENTPDGPQIKAISYSIIGELEDQQYVDSLVKAGINPNDLQNPVGIPETIAQFFREWGQPWTTWLRFRVMSDTEVVASYYIPNSSDPDETEGKHVLQFYRKVNDVNGPVWVNRKTVEVLPQSVEDAERDLRNGVNPIKDLSVMNGPKGPVAVTLTDKKTDGTLVINIPTLRFTQSDGTSQEREGVYDFSVLTDSNMVVVRFLNGTIGHYGFDEDNQLKELLAPEIDPSIRLSTQMLRENNNPLEFIVSNGRYQTLYTYKYNEAENIWQALPVFSNLQLDHPNHIGYPSTIQKVVEGPEGSLPVVTYESAYVRGEASVATLEEQERLKTAPLHELIYLPVEQSAAVPFFDAIALHILQQGKMPISIGMTENFGYTSGAPTYGVIFYEGKPVVIASEFDSMNNIYNVLVMPNENFDIQNLINNARKEHKLHLPFIVQERVDDRPWQGEDVSTGERKDVTIP